MKFDYKYSKGQIVYCGTEELTIARRCGLKDVPSYWVEENELIYTEDLLSSTSSEDCEPSSEDCEQSAEKNKELKKLNYKKYLQDVNEKNGKLSKYARNLNLLALNGQLTPTYGREMEINKIRMTLLRRTKPNVILTGMAGCGKTAIVEEIAKTFVEDYLNTENPHTPIIYDLSLNSLVSGTTYRGDFEKRLQDILDILSEQKNIIVFIDEIHGLNKVGACDGAVSGGQILKPALARGNIKCIGATTTEEYKKYIATDKALARRFSIMEVKPLVGQVRTNCIYNIIKEYGKYFSINTEEITVDEIENIIDNIIPHTVFPDNVVDILDTTLATAKFEKKGKITMKEIKETVMNMTGYLVI